MKAKKTVIAMVIGTILIGIVGVVLFKSTDAPTGNTVIEHTPVTVVLDFNSTKEACKMFRRYLEAPLGTTLEVSKNASTQVTPEGKENVRELMKSSKLNCS